MNRNAEDRNLRSGIDRLSERVVELLRSRVAQVAGLIVGAIALGFFAIAAARAWEDAAPIIGEMTWLSIAIALIAFLWFQALATLSLAAMGANAPARIWAAAQLAKYLPFPGGVAVGMVGSSVRHGHSPRSAVSLLIRHTILLVGGGIAVGSLALGPVLPVPNALRMIAIGLSFAIGVSIAWLAGPRAQLRRVAAVVLGIGAWVGLVLGLYVSFPAPLAPTVAAVSAYPAAWVAGLLVLPVPAGLGVREAVLLVLLTPAIGAEGAVAFAIATRVLHAVADGALIAAFVYRGKFGAVDRSTPDSGS